MHNPLIIGHRGASTIAPENTLIAFDEAMMEGADGVEFDVRLARDGVPVVIHDATLKRTGLRGESVSDLSSTELNKIDVGTWFNLRYPDLAQLEFASATVPTLAKVLEHFKSSTGMHYIEMKCTSSESRAMAEVVVRLVHEHQLSGRTVVESFALESIREVKRLAPDIRTAALFEPEFLRLVPMKRSLIHEALAHQADEISLHRSLANARTIEEARRSGLRVVVWTADHPVWVQRALNEGIHAIISNEPGRMCSARRNLSAV